MAMRCLAVGSAWRKFIYSLLEFAEAKRYLMGSNFDVSNHFACVHDYVKV